jgi:hypothetical protein
MSVTEKLMTQGQFNVALDLSLVPNSILNAIQPFDQIVITNNEVESADRIDKVILPSAEYIGVIRTLSLEPDAAYVEGAGLNFYLGDDDNKGMPITDAGASTKPRDYIGVSLEYFINNDDGQPYGILRRNDNGNLRGIWPGNIYDKTIQETDLLLNFEGTDGDTETTDETDRKHEVTFKQGAEISSDQAKFGSTSLKLTSVNSHLTVDYSPDFATNSEDFTIEWWEYRLTP